MFMINILIYDWWKAYTGVLALIFSNRDGDSRYPQLYFPDIIEGLFKGVCVLHLGHDPFPQLSDYGDLDPDVEVTDQILGLPQVFPSSY